MAAINSTIYISPMPKGIEQYKRYISINGGEFVADTEEDIDYELTEGNGWVRRGDIRVYSFNAQVTPVTPLVNGDLVAYQWRPAGYSSDYGEGFYVTSNTYLVGVDVQLGVAFNVVPVVHNIDEWSVWRKINGGDYTEIGAYTCPFTVNAGTERREYQFRASYKIVAPVLVGDVVTIQLRPAGYDADIGSGFYITSDDIEVTKMFSVSHNQCGNFAGVSVGMF